MNETEEKLKNFLNLLWLRPENGLLGVFKSKAFEDIEIESPSLDISCGDGLFMCMHLGGTFDVDFDYFKKTRAKEFKHSSFVDIYDTCDKDYEVEIVKKPTKLIDYGTDWKQGLLDKASKAGVYKNLILHDNNNVPLPFPDNHFKTIYSNSIYWVNDVESLLSDIYRMLKPGGVAILEVMTHYHLETLEKIKPYLSEEAVNVLDRERTKTMPSISLESNDWKELITKCGFNIEDTRCVYPNKLILDIWNIGLRPISHLLIRMSDALSKEERHEIKQEWVDIFFKLFKPLLSIGKTYSLENAPYIMFKVRK